MLQAWSSQSTWISSVSANAAWLIPFNLRVGTEIRALIGNVAAFDNTIGATNFINRDVYSIDFFGQSVTRSIDLADSNMVRSAESIAPYSMTVYNTSLLGVAFAETGPNNTNVVKFQTYNFSDSQAVGTTQTLLSTTGTITGLAASANPTANTMSIATTSVATNGEFSITINGLSTTGTVNWTVVPFTTMSTGVAWTFGGWNATNRVVAYEVNDTNGKRDIQWVRIADTSGTQTNIGLVDLNADDLTGFVQYAFFGNQPARTAVVAEGVFAGQKGFVVTSFNAATFTGTSPLTLGQTLMITDADLAINSVRVTNVTTSVAGTNVDKLIVSWVSDGKLKVNEYSFDGPTGNMALLTTFEFGESLPIQNARLVNLGDGRIMVGYLERVSSTLNNEKLFILDTRDGAISSTLASAGKLAGTNFNDTLTGSSGNDEIWGAAGDDTINGGDGLDVLNGGAGNDVLAGGPVTAGSQNRLDGGTGIDRADYSATTAAVYADLRSGVGFVNNVYTDVLLGIEDLAGGSGNDALFGNDNANTLNGGAGTDQLYGFGGNDMLIGGTASAGAYNILVGGDGIDTASYAGTLATVYADLRGLAGYVGGVAAGNLVDVFSSIENLTGGSANDTLVGDDGANVLNGVAGVDQLYGFGGDDTLIGGAAAVGEYNILVGGTGSDTVSYVGTTGTVYADLRGFAGFLNGTALANLIDVFSSIENLTGGSGNDLLVGDDNANVVNGAGGSDQIYGFGGDDVLIGGGYVTIGGLAGTIGTSNILVGGTGNDTVSYGDFTVTVYADLAISAGYVGGTALVNLADIYSSIENLTGGSGNDTLRGDGGANRIEGAAGADILFGLAGGDTFVYRAIADSNLTTGADIIADFTTGIDKIDFAAFGINSSKVLITSGGGNTVVYADTDAVVGYDLAVVATGNNVVLMSDILF